MQAGERPIQDVIKREHTFTIPPYQRPYTWGEEETVQLLTDITDAIEGNEREYFIGSIVTIERSKNSEFEVVDGQQRLTTINIIFSALISLIHTEGIKKQLKDRLVVVNPYADPVEMSPRLRVRTQDAQIYLDVVIDGMEILDVSDLTDSQLRFIENKKAACKFLSKYDQSTLKKISEYLEKQVYLVFISAEKFESALRLFNVLNSRGIPLGNSDLIKSHLYGQVNNSAKFEQSWEDIETNIGIANMDVFWGHIRTSLVGEKARTSLFVGISEYLKSEKATPENFIQTAVDASSIYSKIIKNRLEPPSVRKYIFSLLQVNHDDWIPPLLAFLSTTNHRQDFTPLKFISLLEKITYQAWVHGKYRDHRNYFYYQLIKAIKGSSTESIRSVFNNNLNKTLGSSLDENVYGRGFVKALLLRIEAEQQDDSVEKIFNGPITVEHVLPQNMSDPYWTERFSAEDHQDWVHKLGNLTLLSGSKNSSAQNSDFEKKKIIYSERNKKVSFDLTKEICQKQNWSVQIIKNRHENLVEQALKIWTI